jgi:hypothetical protein
MFDGCHRFRQWLSSVTVLQPASGAGRSAFLLLIAEHRAAHRAGRGRSLVVAERMDAGGTGTNTARSTPVTSTGRPTPNGDWKTSPRPSSQTPATIRTPVTLRRRAIAVAPPFPRRALGPEDHHQRSAVQPDDASVTRYPLPTTHHTALERPVFAAAAGPSRRQPAWNTPPPASPGRVGTFRLVPSRSQC